MTDHDHSRTFQADHPEPTTDAARVGLALRELLIEAGHYTADEEQAVIAAMQGASPRKRCKNRGSRLDRCGIQAASDREWWRSIKGSRL